MDQKDNSRVENVFAVMAAIALLLCAAAFNRLAAIAILRQPVCDVLRTCDLTSIFILAPLAVVLLALLLGLYDGFSSRSCLILFVIGVFMTGLGFGMHEPTNAMLVFYGKALTGDFRQSILFIDDGIGHWAFFAGFVFLSLSGVLAELKNPLPEKMMPRYTLTTFIITLITASVIFFNMAYENTWPDICTLLLTVGISVFLNLSVYRRDFLKVPVNIIVCFGYGGGVAATLLYWLVLALLK